MKNQKVLYLDLNGVIANLIPLHLAGWDVVNYILGNPKKFTADDYPFFQGKRSETVIEELVANNGQKYSQVDKEKLGRIKRLARSLAINRLSKTVLFPEAIQFIEQCKAQQITVICFSNSRGCPDILKQLKINHYFDDLIYGDMVRPPKPKSSLVLERHIQKNAWQKQNCLYLEDNQRAIQHTLKAGIPSILVGQTTDLSRGIIAMKDLTKFTFEDLIGNIT